MRLRVPRTPAARRAPGPHGQMDDDKDGAKRDARPPRPYKERDRRHAKPQSDDKKEEADREEAHASGSATRAD